MHHGYRRRRKPGLLRSGSSWGNRGKAKPLPSPAGPTTAATTSAPPWDRKTRVTGTCWARSQGARDWELKVGERGEEGKA